MSRYENLIERARRGERIAIRRKLRLLSTLADQKSVNTPLVTPVKV